MNQTLILCDSAQSVTAADAINMLLADHAWGEVTSPTTWRLTHPTLSISPPPTPPSSSPPSPLSLLTYSDFLDSHHPSLSKRSPSLSPSALRQRKAERNRLRSHFTQPDQPGHSLHPTFRHLLSLTLIPPHLLRPNWPSPHYYLLPAFLLFILHLQHTHTPFLLAFRSFGHDLPHVQAEWNRFCVGEHPAFPYVRLDGSGRRSETERYVDGEGGVRREPDREEMGREEEEVRGGRVDERNMVDRRLYDANCGYGWRTGDGVDDSHFLLGAMPSEELPSDLALPLPPPFHGLIPHSSFTGIAAYLSSALAAQPTLAIRDYYPYWELNRRAPGTGKLLLVDTEEEAEGREKGKGQVSAALFDDSLHDHIVDVRGSRGERLTAEEAARWGVVVHHARLLHILQEPDYFIRVLQRAQADALQQP